jgi:hypothetical protein
MLSHFTVLLSITPLFLQFMTALEV